MSDRKIVPMKINNKTIMVEVEEIDEIDRKISTENHEYGVRNSADLTSPDEGIIESIVDFTETLEATVGALQEGIGKLKPDEWSVELNMGFSAGGNIFIANGKVNSGIKVSAKWKNDKS